MKNLSYDDFISSLVGENACYTYTYKNLIFELSHLNGSFTILVTDTIISKKYVFSTLEQFKKTKLNNILLSDFWNNLKFIGKEFRQ